MFYSSEDRGRSSKSKNGNFKFVIFKNTFYLVAITGRHTKFLIIIIRFIDNSLSSRKHLQAAHAL